MARRDFLIILVAIMTIMGLFYWAAYVIVSITNFPLNTAIACLAIPLLCLSFRGFWPHLPLLKAQSFRDVIESVTAPDKAFALIVVGMDVKAIVRMAYWDVYKPAYRSLTGGRPVFTTAEGITFNAAIDLFAAVLALWTLALLYYSIPPKHREGWNYLTAPFYPKPLFFMRVFRRQ